MYCKLCGKIIDDDSVFCNYCGTKHNISLDKSQEEKTISNAELEIKQAYNLKNNLENKDSPKLPNESIEKLIKSNTNYTIYGIILVFINIILFIALFRNGTSSSQSFYLIITNIIGIIVCIWCVIIAKKLNRNKIGWGIFGFLAPPIALIIIGLLRKK